MIRALVIGIIALIGCGICFIFWPALTMRAYLFGWLFWLGVCLGSMSMLMLQHLTGGRWGWRIHRLAEAATISLPLLVVLFIPILLTQKMIFPWADPAQVQASSILQRRDAYFHYFILRACIYFAVWLFFAFRLRILSLHYDETLDPVLSVNLQRTSACGMVLYFITMSLAAVDWIGSREVDWYSSTFGLLVVMGQGVTGIAFLIVALWLLKQTILAEVLQDLGTLLLTCVILWSYIAFAQFLVTWIGNNNEDITWFHHRSRGGWWWAGLALILLHFGLPFIMLLMSPIKRHLKALAGVAGLVLIMRVTHVLWLVAPSNMGDEPGKANLIDPLALVAIGGLFMSCFLWIAHQRPILTAERLTDDTFGAYRPKPR